MSHIYRKRSKFLLHLGLVALIYGCGGDKTSPSTSEEDSVAVPPMTDDTARGISQENKFNKGWDLNVEVGFPISKVITDSAGEAYAISRYGAVLHLRQHQWEREDLPVNYTWLYDICADGDDVYIVGYRSMILHKKGKRPWVQEKYLSGDLLIAAVYAWKGQAWAACSDGSILHRTGNGKWQKEQLEGTIPFATFYGDGDDLWALGKAAIYHKDAGNTWVREFSSEENVIFHTACRLGNKVWAMGSNGMILYNDGSGHWVREGTDVTGEDLYCSIRNGTDLYVAGNNGIILHRGENGQWTKEISVNGVTFNCLYGEAQDIWAAGGNCTILHKPGKGNWATESGPAKGYALHAMAGRGNKKYAVGDNETILSQEDNGPWIKDMNITPDTPMMAIFSYDKDILVTCPNGIFLHKKPDRKWVKEDSHAGNVQFTGLWENDRSVYLAGSNSTIVHRKKQDTGWIKEEINRRVNFSRIRGSGDDLWAVGDNTTILHKKENGSAWVQEDLHESDINFLDIYTWNNEAWVLGIKDNRGIILHKAPGHAWAKEDIDTRNDHFHALYGRNDTIWAAGGQGGSEDTYKGTILCKAGKQPWTREVDRLDNIHFNSIDGSGNDVYALGNQGMVVHKQADSDWETEETFHMDNLSRSIGYKGLFILATKGFLYKESDETNFINIYQLDKIRDMACSEGDLYCISQERIVKMCPGEDRFPVIDKVSYQVTPAIHPDLLQMQFSLVMPGNYKYTDTFSVKLFAKPYNENNENGAYFPVPRFLLDKEEQDRQFDFYNVDQFRNREYIPHHTGIKYGE